MGEGCSAARWQKPVINVVEIVPVSTKLMVGVAGMDKTQKNRQSEVEGIRSDCLAR